MQSNSAWLLGEIPTRPLDLDRRLPRVLVVEDDARMRDMIDEAIRRQGIETVLADNGEDALAVLLRCQRDEASSVQPIDLVVSDVCMPRLGGLELLAIIRTNGWPVPVVLMSSLAARLREDAARLGAIAMLSKPFDLRLLREILCVLF